MADSDSIRQRIISSVFSKLNASGHDETYVAHIKIWEDAGADEGGKKPRYILLSQASNGSGFIHKSKLNSNGSFSIGKTWKLSELRGLEVLNPMSFNITMSRTYRWQTESPQDQDAFILALVKLFRALNGNAALQLVGVRDPDASDGPPAPRTTTGYVRMERAPTPTNGSAVPMTPPRRPVANGITDSPLQNGRVSAMSSQAPVTSTPRDSARSRRPPSRPQTPEVTYGAYAQSSYPEKSSTPVPMRPATPSQQPPIPSRLRPGRMDQRTSNAESSIRTSMSSSSQVPSIVLASSPTSTAHTVSSSPTDYQANGSSMRPPTPASSSFTQPSPMSAYASLPDPSPGLQPPVDNSVSRRRSPSRNSTIGHSDSGQRREQNARVSFFDPANQAVINRLLADGNVGHEEGEGENEGQGDYEDDETAQITLANVEEMLEGFDWANEDLAGRRAVPGTADQIEAQLLNELMALEKANIHSFIESDDRINIVLQYMDEALAELDGMASLLSSYKIHLNAVSDDIGYIQSQNRGLQVQTQNQRALLNELENLLQTVQVDRAALVALAQESLEKTSGIENLEAAATELYKALQAGRDRDMAATMERLDEYRTHNAQFCKRMLDYLSIMFTAQADLLLGDNSGIGRDARGRPVILDHKSFETYIGRYCGLILYCKEMDESAYAKLCAAYFSASSYLHSKQVKALIGICNSMVKKSTDDDNEGFGGGTPKAAGAAGIRRAGTIVRSPLDGRRDRKQQGDGDLRVSEAFAIIMEQTAQTVYREEEFIADFLQINDAALTFADYMGLENYFRRQAARASGISQSTSKLINGAMDLIFGFLPAELKIWLDTAMAKDHLQVIGIIASLERALVDAEERGNPFLLSILEKQHIRLKGLFDRYILGHIKTIEDTKLTSKKRNGVAPFIKFFPTFITRVETQLIGAETLEIRQTVDAAYDKIVVAMFDALKQMAKMEGDEEDKGQLNYHVIIIENMHYFVAEMSQLNLGSVSAFLKRAESIYEENLNAYIKIVLRRPFNKIIDYFEGVERLLKTTAPSEVSSNSSYSKSALKKVVKEYNAKDVRKNIEALFKRVDKHFTEASEKATTEEVSASTGIAPGTVMVGVWKACEEEMLRITELFVKRISQCYQDTGITLEYSAADVEAAFRKHRTLA